MNKQQFEEEKELVTRYTKLDHKTRSRILTPTLSCLVRNYYLCDYESDYVAVLGILGDYDIEDTATMVQAVRMRQDAINKIRRYLKKHENTMDSAVISGNNSVSLA